MPPTLLRGSFLSIGSKESILSIGSVGSVLSIGSVGSVLSIGSVGSVLSAGSIGSALSFLSTASWLSTGSLLSAQARWSVLSWRAHHAFRTARRTRPPHRRVHDIFEPRGAIEAGMIRQLHRGTECTTTQQRAEAPAARPERPS